MKSCVLVLKIWILLVMSAVRRTCLANKTLNYQQEPVLNNITFQSIDSNNSSVLPLFELKKNLQTPYPMCYPNSTEKELIMLSLTVCKQLGFGALQRYFRIDAKMFGNESTGGLQFTADCDDYQLEQKFCPWKYVGMLDCDELLGVECAKCNYDLQATDKKRQEISIPAYVSCFTNSKCTWAIVNKYPRRKKIVLEFWQEPSNSTNGNSSFDEEAEQVLEVRWLNLKLKTWSVFQTTFSGAVNMDPIKILTSNVTITYSSEDCKSHDLNSGGPRKAASIKFFAQDSTAFSKQVKSAVILYALVIVFLLALILGVVMCTCCYFKRRGHSHRRCNTISMSYIPGLMLQEDEYIEEPVEGPNTHAGSESKDDLIQNQTLNRHTLWSESAESEKVPGEDVNNSVLDFRSGQLDKSPHLRDIVSQLAAGYKGTSTSAADEMQSCTSVDSLHSYYSVHQSRRTSRAESFLSTMSNSPPHYAGLNLTLS